MLITIIVAGLAFVFGLLFPFIPALGRVIPKGIRHAMGRSLLFDEPTKAQWTGTIASDKSRLGKMTNSN